MTAPVSSPRRKSDKIWRDALIRAIARRGGQGGVDEGLNLIADQVVGAAESGDKDAWKEIGDRIDGKPKQQTEHSGPDGGAIPVGIDVRFIDAKRSDAG